MENGKGKGRDKENPFNVEDEKGLTVDQRPFHIAIFIWSLVFYAAFIVGYSIFLGAGGQPFGFANSVVLIMTFYMGWGISKCWDRL